MLIGAFVLEAASMSLFLNARGVGWPLAARVVQGLATGALTSTLGASLLDLQHRERPLGAFINSASPASGSPSAPSEPACWCSSCRRPRTGRSAC